MDIERNQTPIRWTEHEEEVIIQFLKENPDMPITQAAEELAMIIDRTPKSITLRVHKIQSEKGLELPKTEKKQRPKGAINPAHKTWQTFEKEILIRYFKENQDKPDTENSRALGELIGRSEQSVKMCLYRLQQKFGGHEGLLKSLDEKPIISVSDLLKKYGENGEGYDSSYDETQKLQIGTVKKCGPHEDSPKVSEQKQITEGQKGERTVTTVITEAMAREIMGQAPSHQQDKQGLLQSIAGLFKVRKLPAKPLPEPIVPVIAILEAQANVQLAKRSEILLKSIKNVEEGFAAAIRELTGQMEEMQQEIEVLENWAAETLRVKDKLKKYAVDGQGIVKNLE